MHYCACKSTTKLQLLQRVFQRMLTFQLHEKPHHLFQNSVYGFNVDASHRSFCDAVFILFHTHKNITASEVVEVVSECTDTLIDFSRVPTLLELNPVSFYLSLVQQVFYIILIGSAIFFITFLFLVLLSIYITDTCSPVSLC